MVFSSPPRDAIDFLALRGIVFLAAAVAALQDALVAFTSAFRFKGLGLGMPSHALGPNISGRPFLSNATASVGPLFEHLYLFCYYFILFILFF